MIISPRKRKLLKLTAYVLGVLVALLTAFHFWFINHAESLVEDLVESRSNGKLKLKVKNFKFNWFSYDMQLVNAVFYSTDTNTATTAYRFSVDNISVRVKEILPLVFEKTILIDSLSLINPDIRVTKLRSSESTDTTTEERSVSIPQEMGRVYNSIQDALRILQVNRFQIDNGKFTLSNKADPDELPVSITNIFFHLDNLQVDTSDDIARQKILFSDNVALQTHDQDITFPDGRHRLSFSKFRINILKKVVEFDSCTISATKGDSVRRSFSIFFDKLLLTNIDFDTLYQKEVIKADSVYCINPRFKLDVELERKTGPRKPAPKLDELIQQLTGDLQLAFVVVNNASFDINIVRDGTPSSFTSDHNNFELRGLQIQQNSPKPLTVESFAMAIRNYENFLKDSTYSMQFDSIHLNNNNILLSNFSLKQLNRGRVVNDFSMPRFILRGLSWDDLVFERKLTAEKASLFYPIINYSIPQKGRRQDLFEILAGVGDIIQLKDLDVSNGQINLKFGNHSYLRLQNASLSIMSESLVNADRINNLQRAVRLLNFRRGSFRFNGLNAEMDGVNFTGTDGNLTAARMRLTSAHSQLKIDASDVKVNRMWIGNAGLDAEIDGFEWKKADVLLNTLTGSDNAKNSFLVKNLRGSNTRLIANPGSSEASAFLETLMVDEVNAKPSKKIRLLNFRTSGHSFSFKTNDANLKIGRFQFTDQQGSSAKLISYGRSAPGDTISFSSPSLTFVPDLNQLIAGKLKADNIIVEQPNLYIRHSEAPVAGQAKVMPLSLSSIRLNQPTISWHRNGEGELRMEWLSNKGSTNSIELRGLETGSSANSVSLQQLLLAVEGFSIESGGKSFKTGEGKLTGTINDLQVDSLGSDQVSWRGKVADLLIENIILDSLRAGGRLTFKKARLNDLNIKSGLLLNFRELVKQNTGFRLRDASGDYSSDKHFFAWHSIDYDKNSKTFFVDSIEYRPSMSQDSFIASSPYQTDYITLRTGRINIGPFDLTRYLTDTVVEAGHVAINHPRLRDFRDKRKPPEPDVIKQLPVNLLKQIPMKLSLDTLLINDAEIEYAELNEKTQQTGIVTISDLNLKAYPVRNVELKNTDSLQLAASAKLLDSIFISLNLRESYTDSLAGFLLTANISPADATILNSILLPMASAKLLSGHIDTMSMRVVGREYVALGEMRLYYHDLKLRLLNNGMEGKRTLFKSIASFFANLVVKNKNTSRKGVVFFERLRNKSTLNYLVKITLSGVTSSVGVKKNKKRLRKYKKEIRKRNLPGIDFDTIFSGK